MSSITDLDLLKPVLIAIMYFGSGATTFKIGDFEVNLYRKMLDAFSHVLPRPWRLEMKKIQESIEGKAEYQPLLQGVEALRALSTERKWDRLNGKWEKVNVDILVQQIDDLSLIQKELIADPDRIDHIKDIVKDRKDRLVQKMMSGLTNYVIEFASVNGRDTEDVRLIFSKMGIPVPEISLRQPVNVLYRSIMIPLLLGLFFFGPIISFRLEEDALIYSLCGALTLAVFGGILSQTVKCTNWVTAGILGALSGAAAHLTWLIVTGKIEDFEKIRVIAIGAELGFIISILLFALRNYAFSKIHKLWTMIVVTIGAGGIAFAGTLTFNSNFGMIEPITDWKQVLVWFLLGMLALCVSAISTDAFSTRQRSTV